MPRQANQEHLAQLREAIYTHPGEKAGFFARLLRWSREAISRGLISLNDKGELFSEDARGGLWPFDDHS